MRMTAEKMFPTWKCLLLALSLVTVAECSRSRSHGSHVGYIPKYPVYAPQVYPAYQQYPQYPQYNSYNPYVPKYPVYQPYYPPVSPPRYSHHKKKPRQTTVQPTTPLTTPASGGKKKCKKFVVVDDFKRYIKDSNGNPADIVRVKLIKEISSGKCVNQKTYIYEGNRFEVNGGCKGAFRVCYREGDTTPLTTQPPDNGCTTVTLRSTVRQKDRQKVKDGQGNPADITSMKLVRLISGKCKEWYTYYFEGSYVIASHGCSGVFEVCYNVEGALTTVVPDSGCVTVDVRTNSGETKRERINNARGDPAEITSVNLVKQLSNVRCREWVNYLFFKSYLIVKNGCSGRFKVCYKVDTPTVDPIITAPPRQEKVCKKFVVVDDFKTYIKDSNGDPATIVRVKLIKEISRGKCVNQKTYIYVGNRFEVNGGCKGAFRVCYSEGTNPLTTQPPDNGCTTVTLRSTVRQKDRQKVKDGQGNPADITSMKLVRLISGKCKEWKTYYFQGSYVIASHGCSGEFEVCYNVEGALTTVPPDTENCKELNLRSTATKPAWEDIEDSRGRKVRVTSMDVIRQNSGPRCVEWKTFYFTGSKVHVRGGCSGRFKVCYKPKM